jgi:hypothetical protein
MPGSDLRLAGERRMLAVDLAVRGRKGERFGQESPSISAE